MDVRDRVRNWEHAVDRRRETIALDQVGNNGSDEFNRRMLAVNLTLPEGSVVTHDQGPRGEGVNLALTLHVSRDELGSPLPNFTVDGPHIESRK